MLWLYIYLKMGYRAIIMTLFPQDQVGKHSKGRSVMDFPEIAERFMYYRKGIRTYKLYTGSYSRLVRS